MGHGQGAQLAFAGRSEPDHYGPSVIISPYAFHKPALLQAIDQPHGAMVLDKEVSGQNADSRRVRTRKRANRQQHLVLLGLESRLSSCFLAKVQKLADAIAKLAQCRVILGGQVRVGHKSIIS